MNDCEKDQENAITGIKPGKTLRDDEQLKQQAINLKLHGLLAHWHELTQAQYPWLETLLNWERQDAPNAANAGAVCRERQEQKQRSLERRLSQAKPGRF